MKLIPVKGEHGSSMLQIAKKNDILDTAVKKLVGVLLLTF